jgi:hypothetical protein
MATQMDQIQRLNEIFFRAEKKFISAAKTYTVEGYPGTSQDPVFYKKYDNDWVFRTYKEVIFAGLVWTKRLFNSPLSDLRIKHLEYGKRKKRWFNVQVVQTGAGIMIDGEKYNPFINISYSYDTVHSIKFEIGFYRFACSNGVVSGFQELAKLKIKPENIFEFPFWLNPCLILFLSNRYEKQIQILKRTDLKGEDIRNFINQNFKSWKIGTNLIDKYLNDKKIGENGFGLLNILTDSASNFDEHFEGNKLIADIDDDHLGNSERASRQRTIGKFLEKLVEEIEKENEVIQKLDINSNDFTLTNENLDVIESNVMRNEYKFNLKKFKL